MYLTPFYSILRFISLAYVASEAVIIYFTVTYAFLMERIDHLADFSECTVEFYRHADSFARLVILHSSKTIVDKLGHPYEPCEAPNEVGALQDLAVPED